MGAELTNLADLGGATPLRAFIFLTAITLLPGIIISMTAFLRIVLVLGLLRMAMGLQQMPPNQVIIGLALFLTYAVMARPMAEIHDHAVVPYMEGQLQEKEAIQRGTAPLRTFMLVQVRGKDLALMANVTGAGTFQTPEDVPMHVLVPAFVISELRTAFAIGFLLFIPFLVIDVAVAALLNALGMIMLPPTAIALPFKLLIFVLSNGWALLVGALVKSFGS